MADDQDIQVALRWRDLDHQGHVYHATVLTLLDEARTEWLNRSIGVSSPDEYVVARVEVDYVEEIRRSDDVVSASFRVSRLGTTSITSEETVRSPDGRVLVRAVVTAVMWDRTARRPRPLSEEERSGARGRLAVAARGDGHG